MSNNIEISRTLAERLVSKASCVRREAMHELRRLLEVPAIDPQEPAGFLMLGDIFYGTSGPELEDWDVMWNHKVVEALAVGNPGIKFELYARPIRFEVSNVSR